MSATGECSADVHEHGGTEGPLEHLEELWGPELRTHRTRRWGQREVGHGEQLSSYPRSYKLMPSGVRNLWTESPQQHLCLNIHSESKLTTSWVLGHSFHHGWLLLFEMSATC